jgi:hypothetical protein
MIWISHRGNLNGPNPEAENTHTAVEKALDESLHVEVDVWSVDGFLHLGHDAPGERTTERFLLRSRIWCHAKNLEALQIMMRMGMHCFWHEHDQRTLTSRYYIWTSPGYEPGTKGIMVMPEKMIAKPAVKLDLKCAGVCTDYPLLWRELNDRRP